MTEYLNELGYNVIDYGTDSEEPADFPDYAKKLGAGILSNEANLGIAICGTGNGIAITLNKHQGIRAALCWEKELASFARSHNDANILVMPGRFISQEEATRVVEAFLSTPFEGGRHQRRIDKIPL